MPFPKQLLTDDEELVLDLREAVEGRLIEEFTTVGAPARS